MLLLTLDRDRKLIQEEIHNCIIQFSLLVNLKEKNTVSSTISFLTASLERLLNQFEKAGGSRALDRLRRSDEVHNNAGMDVETLSPKFPIRGLVHQVQAHNNAGMDVETLSPKFPIRGLVNGGNTCFLGTALQLLAVIVESVVLELEKYLLRASGELTDTIIIINLVLHILKRKDLGEAGAKDYQARLWNLIQMVA
jgi:hypothetical protein